MTRDKLLEVYSKAQVDLLLPFSHQHTWLYDNMAVIGDADLKRFGFYNESVNLFDMPEELIHNPLNGTKRKLLTGEHVSKFG